MWLYQKFSVGTEHLVCIDKYSSLAKSVCVLKNVIIFIQKLKEGLLKRDPEKYSHLDHPGTNCHELALSHLIKTEQRIYFPELFSYFEDGCNTVKAIPNLVNQLNIYLDKGGLLRVKSKFSRWKDDVSYRFPILLPKESWLTRMIIFDLHRKLFHAGCYRLLVELRKKFWITHCFSVVKGILKACILCRKRNQRTVKLNQSPYRDFRLDPPNIPFRNTFLDHFGPYQVKYGGKKIKVWILCITCLWSRAIYLKVCCDLSRNEFIRAFQMHCFEFGLPELCLSDLGSSLVSEGNVIHDFLKDVDTQNYFQEHGVKSISFEQYFKGCHPLGGIVEICVKMVRKLIQSSIKNYVLEFREFEFIIAQTVHLINRRPVAFQESLRDCSNQEVVPDALTPERLIDGHDLVSVNVIPELQPDPTPDQEWSPTTGSVDHIRDAYYKLKEAKEFLIESYNSEFLVTLMKQAINNKDRYRPVTHQKLSVGDIVLIKEENCKPMNFPMAIVKEVKSNINNEVTDAILMKGKTREIVKRHVTSLIPILWGEDNSLTTEENETDMVSELPNSDSLPSKQKRKAAIESQQKTKKILEDP